VYLLLIAHLVIPAESRAGGEPMWFWRTNDCPTQERGIRDKINCYEQGRFCTGLSVLRSSGRKGHGSLSNWVHQWHQYFFNTCAAFRILDDMGCPRIDLKRVCEALPAAGFIVISTGRRERVEKYGCGAEFRRNFDKPLHYERFLLDIPLMNGQFTRPVGRGYQFLPYR